MNALVKRLASTVWLDIRLQFRNGFYYASLFVAAIWVLILRQLPLDTRGLLMPIFIMTSVTANGFYFIAGLVLLEKGEGTLQAQVISPLCAPEYLSAKAISLGALTVVENMLIAGAGYGLRAWTFPLLAGVAMLTLLCVLYGFIVVAGYDSINEYLLPSVLYASALAAPLLDYFGVLPSPLFYLHPVQASLVLLGSPFRPVAAWQIAYGLIYSLAWSYVAYRVGRRAFLRFIVRKEGVK